MAEEKRKNLGRGLSALLGEDTQDYAQLDRMRASKAVPIEFIQPGRYQPRHRVDDEALKDLAQSIGEKGILQPILVRRKDGQANLYEIIAGERRWRAAQLAGLHEVPVVIKDLTDQETLEIALVENLQRQDLTPLEEAEGYRRLMEEFSHTQEKLSQAVGKSRSHVANMMRLLGLPEPVKELLQTGQLTAGHARALLSAPNPLSLAREIVAKGLNVRQAEALAQGRPSAKPAATPAPAPKKDADTIALERDLSALLGLKVEIKFHGGGGTLAVHYTSLDQLDDILNRLSQGGKAGPLPRPAAATAATAKPAAAAPKPSTPAKPPAPKPAAAPAPAAGGAGTPKLPPPKPAAAPKPSQPSPVQPGPAAAKSAAPPAAPNPPPKPAAPPAAPAAKPIEAAAKGDEKKNSAAPPGN